MGSKMKAVKNNDLIDLYYTEKELKCVGIVVKLMLLICPNHNEYEILTFNSQLDALNLLKIIFLSQENSYNKITIKEENYHIIKQSFNYIVHGVDFTKYIGIFFFKR